MATVTVTIEFQREKETKNTVRFAEMPEASKPPVVGTLYVQKWAAGASRTIRATLTFEDAA